MRTAIFMMPKSFTGRGEIPTDYRFEERACDKRTGFYKSFAKREISAFNAVTATRSDARKRLVTTAQCLAELK